MSTVTRSKIVRGDLALYDGQSTTYSRLDATGGTVTGLRVGDAVDVLQVYGSGTARTVTTINAATSAVGTTPVAFSFANGTWVIDSNLTIPATIACYIPAGCVFSISSGITLTFSGPVYADDNAFTSGSGSYVLSADSVVNGQVWKKQSSDESSASVTPTDYSYDPGDVRRYGATGDGSTDDTTAIQAAIDGNNTSWIPETGTFIFTALRITDGKTFYGKGGTLKYADNTATVGGTSYYLVSTSANGTDQGEADNVIIRDLNIDGNKANNASFTVADAIHCVGDNNQVLNNYILNPPDSGIMFSQNRGGSCNNNYINGATDVGIYVNDPTEDPQYDARESHVAFNRIENCTVGAIAIKRETSRLVVHGNVAYNCGNGITCEDLSGAGNTLDYLTITGNLMSYIGYIDTGQAGRAFQLQSSNGVVLSGNVAYDPRNTGIHIDGCNYCQVTNNAIMAQAGGNTTVGIQTISVNTYNNISHNTVDGTTGRGIWIRNSTSTGSIGNRVNYNTVTNATDDGIQWDSAYTDGQCIGNILEGAAQDLHWNVANGTDVTCQVKDNILVNGAINGNTGWQTGCYQDTFGSGIKITWGSGTPTVGTWSDGDISREVPLAAVDGSNMLLREYACNVAGSPGTWVAQYVSTVTPAT